jgi:hypothetical protein
MPTTYELIKEAIKRRHQIRADYQGRRREMCPHVLGHKNGRAQGLFYQFAGESKSGLKPLGSSDNWRCFCIDELTGVQVVAGPWYTAPHSRPQTCVDVVDVSAE